VCVSSAERECGGSGYTHLLVVAPTSIVLLRAIIITLMRNLHAARSRTHTQETIGAGTARVPVDSP